MISRRAAGFSLVELLVAMLVSGILIAATVSTYSIFRKSITLDQNRANLAQNARVAFDRMSREIRQATAIVTEMPSHPSDGSVAQPGEIEFEDGHAGDLTYKRYYIVQNSLKLDVNEYYFTYDAGNRVAWNAVGNGGVAPIKNIISTQDVADGVSSISFYGPRPVQFVIVTADNLGQSFTIRSQVHERNL